MKETTTLSSRCSLLMLRCLAPLLLLSLLAGCATPVGVTKVSAEKSYRLSTVNPLNQGIVSNSAKAVLQRYNLGETFHSDPQSAIQFLHETAIKDDRRDILFALAELSYLNGERLLFNLSLQAFDSFLQSAVYAYLYLLGDGTDPPPDCLRHPFP